VPHYVPPSRTAATRESIFTPNENEISCAGRERASLRVEEF